MLQQSEHGTSFNLARAGWLIACCVVFVAEAQKALWLSGSSRVTLAWLLLFPGLLVIQGVIALLDIVYPRWSLDGFAFWRPALPILIWTVAFILSYAVFFVWLPRFIRRVGGRASKGQVATP